MSIKVKRGLAINLPTLEEGELGFTTDSYEMYVGSDNGNILLNNGEILIRRNNGMLQYAQSSRKNQWFDICSLEEIRGDRGIQGIQGIQGVKGDKGDKGERGIQGEKGNPFTYADFTPDQLRALKGEKGDTGAKGERGLTGDKGDRGVGLNYAWSGTRLGVKRDTDAQYTYVDLRGADGKDGKQGERGERGIQGEKGDTPSIAHLEKQISDKSKELDTKFEALTSKQQQDSEVINARDGEVSLNARLERDLEKGKIHFVDVEGSSISTESEEGYLENVEIYGNTWQNAENLADIRSVGTKVEGQELYEIPVLSRGKNLFNINEDRVIAKGTSLNDSFRVIDNAVEFATPYFVIGSNIVGYKINIKPNTDYKFNFNVDSGKCAVRFYNENLEEIIYNNNPNFTFNSGNSNVVYLQFTSNVWNTLTRISNIQLEEGTVATPYEPYQEDKLTILSPTPLEKVGDVVDRIVCKDGVWGVEKNIKTIIADGVNVKCTNVSIGNTSNVGEITVLDFVFKGWSGKGQRNVLCDKLPNGLDNASSLWTDSNHIMCNTRGFWLSCSTDINTIDKFNSYLKQNPHLIKYESKEPQFIPLPHSQQIKLRTFANKTHISFDTEIQPTIKAQVPKSLGATVNTHTSQIDNLNKELDRVKKLEESTVTTVTSDKAFTTVTETTQGYFEDVKIEGKTLVNLANNSNNIPNPNINHNVIHPRILDVRSKNYTLVIKLNTSKQLNCKYAYTDGTLGNDFKFCDANVNGVVTKLITPNMLPIDFDKEVNGFRLSVVGGTPLDVTIDYIEFLEGDHTDKDITFFEGLKSVGQGANEIEISIPNKNILKPTKEKYRFYIKKGTKLVLSEKNNTPSLGGNVKLYDINGNVQWFPIDAGDTNPRYITVWKDVHYMENTLNGNLEYQVEVGTERTSYVPYSSNKKTLLYYNPTTQTWEKPVLREWDSIEKHSDGKYYYHKRSGEVVLNGSENWSISGIDFNDSKCFWCNFSLKPGSTVVSDKFASLSPMQTEAGSKVGEGISTHHSTPSFRVLIKLSKLSTQDVAGFKQWLQANPTTVVYQLAKEEIYECTNLDLITYPNVTNLIVSSGAIQPKITLKVLSNISNVVKLLQEKVSVLENKFIEGLKQVLAGDMMSLAHLLYPEDFVLENDTPQVIPYIEEGDINE